jgi:hypothetical protein
MKWAAIGRLARDRLVSFTRAGTSDLIDESVNIPPNSHGLLIIIIIHNKDSPKAEFHTKLSIRKI